MIVFHCIYHTLPYLNGFINDTNNNKIWSFKMILFCSCISLSNMYCVVNFPFWPRSVLHNLLRKIKQSFENQFKLKLRYFITVCDQSHSVIFGTVIFLHYDVISKTRLRKPQWTKTKKFVKFVNYTYSRGYRISIFDTYISSLYFYSMVHRYGACLPAIRQ